MREIVLDTTVVIAFFKNDPAVLHHLNTAQAVVSATALGELYTGAYLATKQSQQLAYIAGVIANVRIVTCDQETAERFGTIKADLQRRGAMIPVNDIWIAASALQLGLPLAARVGHFARLSNVITVEQW